MDYTTGTASSGAKTTKGPGANGGVTAAAEDRLKEGWEEGKETARELKKKATETWNDLTDRVDRYVETRPKTIALGALGAGLVLGFLTGVLMERNS